MTQHARIDWQTRSRSVVLNNENRVLTLADVAVGPATRLRLRAIADNVSAEEDREFRRLLPGASAKARFVAQHWNFCGPANAIDELLLDTSAFPASGDAQQWTRLRRAAVARLVLEFFAVETRLPYSIIALYDEFFARLAKFLSGKAVERYDDDYFAKDVRYALGLTVPAGTAQVDLCSYVGPKLIVRDCLRSRSPTTAFRYASSAGWGQWYNHHLDLRWMKEFNPKGWSVSYARIAEMLGLNPSVRGLAGVSWFYDPEVSAISPQLAYLRDMPVRHGAFLVHVGTLPHDIENATVRSPLRKKLYDEGRYRPTCYALAWPRRQMIQWARSERAAHGEDCSGLTASAPAATAAACSA